MTNILKLTFAAALLLSLSQAASSQTPLGQAPAIARRQVTASAATGQVRFASLGELIQMRLEVINSSGEIVFDSDFKARNVIDWPLTNRQGEHLSDGSYLCVVTVKDSLSQISRRYALISLSEQTVESKRTDRSVLTASQAQVLGEVPNEDDGLILIEPGQQSATAILAHDGSTAHLVSGSGGLAFSSGDFFANKLLEHMRLTAEGNLGIGVANPQAKLDVAGLIRSSQGILFPDGTVQYSAARKTLGAKSSTGSQIADSKLKDQPPRLDISGSGTTGQITKWLDGPGGVVGDSIISELGGSIGINGAPNPTYKLDVNGHNRFRGSNVSFYLTGLKSGGNEWLFQTVDADGRLRVFDNTSGAERLSMTQSGNVGIGTASPVSKLDVVGAINTSTQYNIGGNRVLSTAGAQNAFVGVNAGAANTGFNNSFFGHNAGTSNTAGNGNSFFGASAGSSNITGTFNSFFGSLAGFNNTTGTLNSFFGREAGELNSTGSHNSFFGTFAGVGNSTGNNNSFFGTEAGESNTFGNSNSFFGESAGASNTTASGNSFFGRAAGAANTTGFLNAFFGSEAGLANQTGSSNAFFGFQAGFLNTTACCNSFFGASAGAANTTGGSNAFFGRAAGSSNTTACCNSFFGESAGADNSTGDSNSFFGEMAGAHNTTGANNSFLGKSAGFFNLTGVNDSFFGTFAGQGNTSGSFNSFFGRSAGLSNTTADSNSFFGTFAGQVNTTGARNSVFGSVAGVSNTTGADNSFFGEAAGSSNTTGGHNTFVGRSAGTSNTTESDNTFIGHKAEGATGITNATVIGANAVVAQSNSVVLGSNANVGIGSSTPAAPLHILGPAMAPPSGLPTSQNGLLLGLQSTTGYKWIQSYLGPLALNPVGNFVGIGTSAPAFPLDVAGAAHATSFPTSSDARLKTNISQLTGALERLEKIRGVAFDWNEVYQSLGRSTGHREIGVVAQEVEAVFPELVTRWGEQRYRAVDYGRLTGVLIEAVKELRAEKNAQVEALETDLRKQVANLQRQNTELNALVTALQKRMNRKAGIRGQGSGVRRR